MSEFQPKIIGFLCNWCSYAGADAAGIARLQLPVNFKVVRVMCSGRVRAELVMKALLSGMDGVMVLGCHVGDCHYISGNHAALKRFALLEKIIEHIGINKERMKLDWISASEAKKFKDVVTEFVDKIKSLGPIEFKEESS